MTRTNPEETEQYDMTTSTGVVVGKFNPPHLGHQHLITVGARSVDRLTVVLCDRPDQTLSADARRRWLVDASPHNVDVIVTPDDIPTVNEPWAERVLTLLPTAPDRAFTSEDWGPEWAALMGAEHIAVDDTRDSFPISGTALRGDLGANFHWLVPAARAELARRVVVVGAESTGKTTLANDLAQALGTVWVPEFGRSYWEGRRHLADQSWTGDEFVHIADGQQRAETCLARRATNGVVVSDTDAMVTAVWHHRYLGRWHPALESPTAPDLYIVCTPDIPWVQDGTRESEAHRRSMHDAILDRATASPAEVLEVRGDRETRLAAALEAVRPLTRFAILV